MLKVITTLVVVIAILVAGYFIFVYTGMYSVAADEAHMDPVLWTLSTVKLESIKRHAAGVEVPEELGSEAMQEQGLEFFHGMCVTCHGAPGVNRSPIGQGLNPAPPSLQIAVEKYTPEQLYWILQHGIKMTGMPAFGETHTREALWSTVAFILELPGMTPEQYQERLAEAGLESGGGHHGGRGGGGHYDGGEGDGDTHAHEGSEDAGEGDGDTHAHEGSDDAGHHDGDGGS